MIDKFQNHYILDCLHLENNRKMFLSKIYYDNLNIIKFNELMNTYENNLEKLNIFSTFFGKLSKSALSKTKTYTTYCISILIFFNYICKGTCDLA